MKEFKIIGISISLVLSILFHFMYDIFPNTFFSIICPVNESVWEHMKLIVTSSLCFSIFEYIMYKKENILVNNFILSYAISCLLGVIIYLVLYIPLDSIFGYKAYIAIFLLLIIFYFIQMISYYIINKKEVKYGNYLGIILIIIIYVIFGYLTYHPIKISLFYDNMHKCYGIRS